MSSVNGQIVDTLPHLHRYAWHLTRSRDEADDLVQDCIERAMRKSELFQPGTSLRAWMFTMMRNIFINGKRRQSVSDRHLDGLTRSAPMRQEPTQFHAAVLSRTQTAIDSLSEDEREAVMLLAVEQHSYIEVAAENGNPTGTMKSRLSRARAKLRAAVMEDALPA